MRTYLHILILTFGMSLSTSAWTQTGYGELMLLESLDYKLQKSLSLGAHHDLSDAVSQVKGLNLNYQQSIHPFMRWGVQLEKNFENKSAIEIATQSADVVIVKEVDADIASHLTLGFTPIHGHLRVLNSKSVKMNLQLLVGFGPAFYKDNKANNSKWGNSTLLSLGFEVFVNERVFITPSLQQIIRDINDSNERGSKSRAAIEVGLRF